MIGIHPVHRRLAELYEKAERVGGFASLSEDEQRDLRHCLTANANLVFTFDKLSDLSTLASMTNDQEWQFEICSRIDKLGFKTL